MPDNLIRSVYIARVKQLMALYSESESIDHGATKGAMREEYLKDFLKQVLPQSFWPVSGFIADRFGNTTPQLDMIFFDRSDLPTLSLIADTSVVPVEVCLGTVEVKSTIDNNTFAQLKNQDDALKSLRGGGLASSPRDRGNVFSRFIVSFDSKLSLAELRRRRATLQLSGICVVNKYTIVSHPLRKTEEFLVQAEDGNEHEPLLTFAATLFRELNMVALYNSPHLSLEEANLMAQKFRWPWEAYLSEALCAAYAAG